MPVLDCPIAEKAWINEAGQRNGVALRRATAATGKAVEDAGPWEPTVQKIVEFQHLGDDWDGLGAQAPSPELLASAVGLAYLLYEKGIDPPHRVVPGLEGSVILEWQDPDGTYADIEILRPLFAEVMVIERGQPAKHWTLPTE